VRYKQTLSSKCNFFIYIFSSVLSSVHLTVPLSFTRRYSGEHSAEPTELYTEQYLAQSMLIYGFCRRESTAAVRGLWLGRPKTPQPIGSVPHLLSNYKFTNSLTRKWTTLLWYTNFSQSKLTGKLNPGFPWQKHQWTKSRLYNVIYSVYTQLYYILRLHYGNMFRP